jgi:hypothetical protein
MGKSSSAPDTSGLEEATKQATALQKQIYEETREDVQPWYQMGTGAVSKLSDLLGITGGSVLGREDIYNELLPQYTSQVAQDSSGLYRTADGRILTREEAASDMAGDMYGAGVHSQLMLENQQAFDKFAKQKGLSLFQPAPTSQTDFEALNAAVEARLAQQQETPEGYGSLLERFGMEQYQQDPGYQFRQDEARKALERNMAAQGVTLGGGGFGEVNPQAYRALDDLSQNLASQEYGNAYNRYVNDQLNAFNMLMGASGSGQQVTGQMAGAGQNYATNVGNLQTGLAQAQYQAAQADQGSMFSNLLGSLSPFYSAATGRGNASQMAQIALMSDSRVKENIKYTHSDNGHKMYNFNYIGDGKIYNGVMAQDILETNPEAVFDIDGILHVNYGALGVNMTEVN